MGSAATSSGCDWRVVGVLEDEGRRAQRSKQKCAVLSELARGCIRAAVCVCVCDGDALVEPSITAGAVSVECECQQANHSGSPSKQQLYCSVVLYAHVER